ncbi:hypothetical protein B0T20DRAFT_349363 [Sordaria brevicollis]|uniref:Uncharacterized protein n=1 Tax=Sordaria brevicollis TaxID=83679 RepID=A0AAE0PI19_SORBR|nr:hypothetical protein B0T20DRAFT_349363 [Sordaria brevicollis]
MDFGKMMDDAGKGFDEFAKNTEKAFEDAGKGMDEFGQNAQKGFEEAGRGMDEFGQNAQKQAEEVGKGADEFGKNMSQTFSDLVGNALKQAEQVIINFTEEISEEVKGALGLGQDRKREVPLVPMKVTDWISNILPKLVEAAGALGGGIKEQIQKAKDWVSENPEVMMYIMLGVTGIIILAAPGLLMTPILGAIGFGASGIAAGSMAAAIQSGIGNVAAGSVFAGLTGAAMGGLEGTAIVAVGEVIGAVMMAGGAAGAAGTLMNKD